MGAFTWLTRLARGLGTDDPRSMDARRADILAALLNGRLVTDPDTDTDTDTGTERPTRWAPPTDAAGDQPHAAATTAAPHQRRRW